MTQVIKEAQDSHLEELATKGDLRELKLELGGRLNLIQWMLAVILMAQVLPLLKSFFGMG